MCTYRTRKTSVGYFSTSSINYEPRVYDANPYPGNISTVSLLFSLSKNFKIHINNKNGSTNAHKT